MSWMVLLVTTAAMEMLCYQLTGVKDLISNINKDIHLLSTIIF